MSHTTVRDRRNTRRYTLALFAWAVVFLGATYLIRMQDLTEGLVAWALAVLPSGAAAVAVAAYAKYLREADELQRAIELQALAVAVSAGFIVWPGLKLIAALGVGVDNWDVTLLVMIAAYVVGSLRGRRRYR